MCLWTRNGKLPRLLAKSSGVKSSMRRREFFTLVGAAAASPLVARAQQQAKMKRIAMVNPSEPPEDMVASHHPFYRAFFGELDHQGFVEGKNLVVERLSGLGQSDRIGRMAYEAIEKRPDAIFNLTVSLPFVWKFVIKTTIPVITTTADPVAMGLVQSVAHPGGYVTGVSIDAGVEIWGKRIGLLKEVLPTLSNICVITSASQKDWEETPFGATAREAAKVAGVELRFASLVDANRRIYEAPYQRIFATFGQDRPDALLIEEAVIHFTNRVTIVELAAKQRLPAMYGWRDFADIGGLISYGVDLEEMGRSCGYQMGQILRGINPGDLPFIQVSRYLLTLNLKTAKSLGIEFPATLLGSADFVIE